jgi:hypothetical protein
MRTTVRIDDDLLETLKAQARKEKISLTRLFNRALKAGLQRDGARRRPKPPFRQRAHAMGTPRLPLDKALALAAALEDEEIVRELTVRK